MLICVHLLIVGHIMHWWITGRSVGRFVLSDSMRALELGEVTPGALLFAGALLTTALLGRFMCGWACHMGALQDLCAWLLRRVGIRPRLFRSRVLGYAPLALAAYMFLWPTFEREVVARLSTRGPGEHPHASFPGFRLDLVSDDLWADMPSWEVAVPFLLICGFATVYFLGARGLCRYACPYGGFLLPAEQLAPGRVVVDMSKCDQCGICTSACTAGVRVHDEVRLYGGVMDRNCVRSLDCVGACPQRALRFTLARPPLLQRRPPRPASVRPDLSLGDECPCAVVAIAAFFTLRGLYELIPLLLAATLSVLAAFVAWKTRRLFLDPNVRLGRAQLRLHGRLRPAGRAFQVLVSLAAMVLIHSACVRAVIRAASRHDDLVGVPYEIAVTGVGVLEHDRAHALEAKRLYALARPFWRGGIALTFTPSAEIRLAWVSLVAGDKPGAIRVLDDLARVRRAGPNVATELARLLLSDGRLPEAVARLETTVQQHPRWAEPRDMLAFILGSQGDVARAEELYRGVLARRPTDARAHVGLANLMLHTGRADEAVTLLRRAARDWPGNVLVRRELAGALLVSGRRDEAIAELRDAADAIPAHRTALLTLVEQVLAAAPAGQ